MTQKSKSAEETAISTAPLTTSIPSKGKAMDKPDTSTIDERMEYHFNAFMDTMEEKHPNLVLRKFEDRDRGIIGIQASKRHEVQS